MAMVGAVGETHFSDISKTFDLEILYKSSTSFTPVQSLKETVLFPLSSMALDDVPLLPSPLRSQTSDKRPEGKIDNYRKLQEELGPAPIFKEFLCGWRMWVHKYRLFFKSDCLTSHILVNVPAILVICSLVFF